MMWYEPAAKARFYPQDETHCKTQTIKISVTPNDGITA
jgi:hypothetical protein